MATDVLMPQMGESIAEGTVVRWIKKVGDKVDRDEPLFEISTDKVDAEIPSPAAGVLSEIRVQEGETVPVNSVVAVIGAAGAAEKSAAAPADKAAAPATEPAAPAKAAEPPKPTPQADGSSTATAPPKEQAPADSGHYHERIDLPPPPVSAASRPTAASAGQARESAAPQPGPDSTKPQSTEDAIRERSSPLVRRIAKEHNVDISQIQGTGIAGRVTKDDILGFIEKGAPQDTGRVGQVGQVGHAGGGGQGKQGQEGTSRPSGSASGAPVPAAPQFKAGASDHVEKMSVMRKRIAEHMVMSRKTSAHVHSVFEVNFSRVAKIREAKKAEFERAGAKLTYLSFIIKAAVDALRTSRSSTPRLTAIRWSITGTSTSASLWRSTGG